MTPQENLDAAANLALWSAQNCDSGDMTLAAAQAQSATAHATIAIAQVQIAQAAFLDSARRAAASADELSQALKDAAE